VSAALGPGFWGATSGTWINLLTVLAGTLMGTWLGSRLRPQLAAQWRQWLGLITLVLALQMVQPLLQQRLGPFPAVLPALLALVLGIALGELGALELRLNRLLERFQPVTAAAGRERASVLSGAFVLFCVGPMTLLGCLRNGALGDPDLLLVKAGLDGLSAALLASGVGLALLAVLLPLGLVQLSLSGLGALLAGGLDPGADAPLLLFTAALGGLLVLGLALELLDLPHPSITNSLPALLLAPLLGWGVR
jgi:uncharacterized membrane protein YqgA involved in biofilm formation